ncbi:DUF4190 domain-containing protein [Streptomyces sp. NPDC058542]|uniref:DUF4190 domain-containing protein n=1 Tax=Streptomyces sp. NPDC058542 TaxID=3346543 RepID=UPI003656AD0A
MAGPYGTWRPAPRQPLSGLAVASLVLSLLICLAPLGLVLGIVALVRLPGNGKRGKGLAVAGTAVGGAVVAMSVLLLVIGGVRFDAWTTEGGEASGPRDPGTGSLFDLREDDCFTPTDGLPTPGGDRLKSLSAKVVPCDEAHQGQVYGSFELAGEAFPGAGAIAAETHKGCAPLLHDFALDTVALPRIQMYYYYPEAASWARGNRTVLCWVGSAAGPLEKSLRQDAAAWDGPQLAYLTALRPASEARVSRPAEEPRSDLDGATAWAGRMADGASGSARLLRAEEGFPATARGPADAFADRFDELSGVMRSAAKASTAEEFERLLGAVGQNDGTREEQAVRAALGLVLPGGGDLAG